MADEPEAVFEPAVLLPDVALDEPVPVADVPDDVPVVPEVPSVPDPLLLVPLALGVPGVPLVPGAPTPIVPPVELLLRGVVSSGLWPGVF